MHWTNQTGIDYAASLDTLLGFIYCITNKETGEYYIGRKQFWSKRGKSWVESDWRQYQSSSNELKRQIKGSGLGAFQFEIIAVFTSKSAMRYSEAAAIIISKAYEDRGRGLNWNFAGCRGPVKLEDTDAQQLNHLRKWCEQKALSNS